MNSMNSMNSMNQNNVEDVLNRLRKLGVNTSDIYGDYYKIPLENIELSKVENELPKKGKVINKHTVIVDSRQRDYSLYSDANYYLVDLLEPRRGVERIELIAAMLPKTEYNVNTDNNLILLTINGITEQLSLRTGQYLIGSNVVGKKDYSSNGNTIFNGLLHELVNTLNQHSQSGSSFNAFLATVPETQLGGTGSNASILNRVVITCGSQFNIDFTNQNLTFGSPFRLLGFTKSLINSSTNNKIYGSTNTGVCSQSDLTNENIHTISTNSIVGSMDYNMNDDPQIIIMQLEFGNRSAERVESIDIATNQKFAVVIYDANDPDNISSYSSQADNSQPLIVNCDRKPGRLKALKGSDFDKKIIHFDPPITLENFKVSFYKYNNELYDFHGREHLLTFELDVAEYDPRYRY